MDLRMRFSRTLPLVLILAFVKMGFSSTSSIYKPDHGALRLSWTSPTAVRSHNIVPGFPECPPIVQNLEKFEWTDDPTPGYHHLYSRFESALISPVTGQHQLIFSCTQYCIIIFSGKDYSLHYNIDRSYSTWTSYQLSLIKGYRYVISADHYGNSTQVSSLKVGIRFPNGTVMNPIDGRCLWRSMSLYNWKGFFVERYDSLSLQPYRDNYTELDVINANLGKYPENPTSVIPCSQRLHHYENTADYFALRYTGFIRPPKNGNYTFIMFFDDFGHFHLEGHGLTLHKNGRHGDGQIQLGPVKLSSSRSYRVEAFLGEFTSDEKIDVKFRISNGNYTDTWQKLTTSNLESSVTYFWVWSPNVYSKNSTVLSVTLHDVDIPDKDNWKFSHVELYYRKRYNYHGPFIKLGFESSLPIRDQITGLSKYTWYRLYAVYFGTLGTSFAYNLPTGYSNHRTAEDVPDAYPTNFDSTWKTANAIGLSWLRVTNTSQLNGILHGHEIRYKSSIGSAEWESKIFNASSQSTTSISSLTAYTEYKFRIAARTSKGSGVFSPIISVKTAESTPSASPSNITAENASSSSVVIRWDSVPTQHQKGIITKYTVYVKPSVHSGPEPAHVFNAPLKEFTADGLEIWTFYSVTVSASTSKGEGPKSSPVQVRTDEGKPISGPQGLTATANTSRSVRLSWLEVNPMDRRGIIVSYEIKYQRSDKKDTEKYLTVENRKALVTGLESFTVYDFQVAGMTRKGSGVFSSAVQEKTLEDVPIGPPTSLKGNNVSSTAIRVTWDVIKEDERKGIIVGYNVRWKLNNSAEDWKNVSTDGETYSMIIGNLSYYAFYAFEVAGRTAVGLGPYSDPVVIQTDADGPTKAPSNLTGAFIDHRNISMNWSCVPEGFRSGIILGYKLMYKDGTNSTAPWINETIPNTDDEECAFNTTLINLKIYTPYIFKIAGYTYRAVGVFSHNVTVWTDEFIPAEVPRDFSGQNSSSTEINLGWTAMNEIDGDANGKVLGYRLQYQVVDCYDDRPKDCDENHVFSVTLEDAEPSTKLRNLRKYTNYSIKIQVFNIKGDGNFTSPIFIKTDQDKPDAPPEKVETWPGKSDTIRIFWSPIPESLRNGIILGYRIFYRPLNVPLRLYNRAPRSLNSLAIFGALKGEKMKEVDASVFETDIAGLKKHNWYAIRIGGVTSKGLGLTYEINGTCKQLSPIKAPELTIVDKYALNEITLSWSNISYSSARGEVLGYRIKYQAVEINLDSVPEKVSYTINTLAPNRTFVLKNLQPFVKYGLEIAAYTEGGVGVFSDVKYAETCRCKKTIYTSWKKLPPLVNFKHKIEGILPKYIEAAIKECCSSCSGQGMTQVDWKNDGFNSTARRYDTQGLHDAVMQGTHIAFPVFKDTVLTKGDQDANFIYVPIIKSAGMAIFSVKPTIVEVGNDVALNLLASVFNMIPLLIVMLVMTTLSGVLIWTAERGSNSEEFPRNCLRGTGVGFWLAFITMTTAGYGDIAPKTKLGRVLIICWTFVSLVLLSLVLSSISNTLTVTCITPKKIIKKTNEKTLASNDTFMISITKLHRRTVIGNTSDGDYVKDMLLSGNVSSVIYDVNDAMQFKDVLNDSRLMFEGLKHIDASYGILLAGDAKRLKFCLEQYFTDNSMKIFQEISNQTSLPFKNQGSVVSVLTENLLSPEADVTRLSIRYAGFLLAVLCFLGSVFELIRCIRSRAKVTSSKSVVNTIFEELDNSVQELIQSAEEIVNSLDIRHGNERIALLKMKKHDLLTIAPDLVIFDQTLELTKQSPTPTQKKYFFDHQSDDSDVDHPMDYKIS